MAIAANTSAEKLAELRAALQKQNVDGFLIPRADEFQGEEVPDSAERLAWLTGFTGSAGLAVVLDTNAAVISDGRYTIQMGKQVDAGDYDAVTAVGADTYEWIIKNGQEKSRIGYDPALHTVNQIDAMARALEEKEIKLVALDSNPLDSVWDDRPQPPMAPATIFDEKIAGKTGAQKRQEIAETISRQNGAAFIMSMPDSVGWLLNVRGDDLANTPQTLSSAVVHENGKVDWYIDDAKMTKAVRAHVGHDVTICDPADIDNGIDMLCQDAARTGRKILMDYSSCPVAFYNPVNNSKAEAVNVDDPVILPRACKTATEQDAIRRVHERDGVALARFLKWVDDEAPKGTLTEMDAVDKLYSARQKGAHFKGNSFDTISGWAGNGADTHYHVTAASNATITPPGLLLVDSGGQYSDGGTTDITRTICVGTPTQSMKEHFTRALKGHIAIARVVFPEGLSGKEIDILTRQALWEMQEDYTHGTGHGVGCYSRVHENGVGISSRANNVFREGMLVSNEPGFYKEGAYGIRIENLVMVQKNGNMKDGRARLSFETVSLAPIDRRLIERSLMLDGEVAWLDDYHRRVFDRINPQLSAEPDVQDWLKKACRPL